MARRLKFLDRIKPWQAVALAAGAVGVAWWVTEQRGSRKKKPKVDCSKVKTDEGELHGVRYLEHVTGGADPADPLPMLIVFHSLGANPKGTAGFKGLPPTRVIRPFGLHRMGKGYRWWKTQARGDQAELTQNMLDASKTLVPFVRDLPRCRPTLGQPVVTGSSQGGMVAYMLATLGKEHVGGSVAVLGWLPEALWNQNMAPTVGLHGTKDNTVKYAPTKKFAETMGFPFYSFDTGHSISKPMGKKWREEVAKMLGHKRGQA